MGLFQDQTGRIIPVLQPLRRIISLVPSQTELLYDLGLDEEVLGITKFCIYPEKWFRQKTRVGGTKNLRLDTIAALKPDLIIANKEENTRAQVETLSTLFPVWISDIKTLADACDMITRISALTSFSTRGNAITHQINSAFNELRKPARQISVCYLIWREPYMTIGHDTFIHDMLVQCGLVNVFADMNRYPVVTLEEIKSKQCDYIFLSSEPYPFKESDALELTNQFHQTSGTKVMLTDGEFFSWYGSRLISSAAYFQTLIDKLQHAAATDR